MVCEAAAKSLYLFLCFRNDKRRENKWNQANISARLDQTHLERHREEKGIQEEDGMVMGLFEVN